MRYLKYVALFAVLMVPLAYSQAQVSVGIGVGPVGVVGIPMSRGRRFVSTVITIIIRTPARPMATMGQAIS